MNEQAAVLVLPLDAAEATLEQVGGKGASLARLVRAGLPVPSGFHVTTAAYRRFVAANALEAPIVAAASGASADDPASLERAAARIRALFAAGAMPDDVAEAVRRAYARLAGAGGSAEPAVAVRSSATAEDLPDLSFAGQQESYLNVRGETAVLDAVKRCWASLWTARVIGYRARHGIPPADVSLAVVGQELVPADHGAPRAAGHRPAADRRGCAARRGHAKAAGEAARPVASAPQATSRAGAALRPAARGCARRRRARLAGPAPDGSGAGPAAGRGRSGRACRRRLLAHIRGAASSGRGAGRRQVACGALRGGG